jgi:hypothetical protein
MLFPEREATLNQINERRINTTDIAKLAEVPTQRVSDFKNDRRVETKQAQKIVHAVHQIYTVLSELNPVKIDCRDPESVRRAFAQVSQVRIERATAEYVEQAEIGLVLALSTN